MAFKGGYVVSSCRAVITIHSVCDFLVLDLYLNFLVFDLH
jgi:hypothetical protein